MFDVCVVIINWNGLEDTIECIDSLLVQKRHFCILVVDNNSDQDEISILSKKYIKYKNIYYAQSNKNLGYAGGCNFGIVYAFENISFKYLIISNNDVIFEKNMLGLFVDEFEKNKLSAATPKIYLYNSKKVWWQGYVKYYPFFNFIKRLPEPKKTKRTDYISGCCFIINKEAILKTGLLNENFFFIWARHFRIFN